MASFATLVKDEITRLDYSKVESISLLSAFTYNSGKINDGVISYQTENSSIARLIYKEIKRLYKVTPNVSIRKSFTFVKKTIYTPGSSAGNVRRRSGTRPCSRNRSRPSSAALCGGR